MERREWRIEVLEAVLIPLGDGVWESHRKGGFKMTPSFVAWETG